MATKFIKRKGLYLNLEDFKIIEEMFRDFENAPNTSLSNDEDSVSLSAVEKDVLWKVRRIISNMEGALRYREMNSNSREMNSREMNNQENSIQENQG